MVAPFRIWIDPDVPGDGVHVAMDTPHLTMATRLRLLQGWSSCLKNQIRWRHGQEPNDHTEATLRGLQAYWNWVHEAYRLAFPEAAPVKSLSLLVQQTAIYEAKEQALTEIKRACEYAQMGHEWQRRAVAAVDALDEAVKDLRAVTVLRGGAS